MLALLILEDLAILMAEDEWSDGHAVGYREGHAEGYEDGYVEGYDDRAEDSASLW